MLISYPAKREKDCNCICAGQKLPLLFRYGARRLDDCKRVPSFNTWKQDKPGDY